MINLLFHHVSLLLYQKLFKVIKRNRMYIYFHSSYFLYLFPFLQFC